MPKATRLGDMSTGHPHCYPPTASAQASGNVFVNGRGQVRVGDAWAVHGACSDHSPHSGNSSSGSATVFVNGKSAVRIGDTISCGDAVAEGSDIMFVYYTRRINYVR